MNCLGRVLSATVLLLCFFCLFAAADEPPIRVGYFDDGDYMSLNRVGEYSGFNIEYLQELAKFGDMHYEMVDGGTWEHTLELLREGRIDIVPCVLQTEERQQEMFFSDLPMTTTTVTLSVRANDDRYKYEDFPSFQGMRVGVISKSLDGELFRAYCARRGIKATIIPYPGKKALLAALEDKRLDGIATMRIGRNTILRTVARFAPKASYIAINKNRPELVDRIDASMNAVVLREPDYSTRLYAKYFSSSTSEHPAFTTEEEAFLKEGHEVRVGFDPSWAPLAYTEPQTEQPAGVTAELLALFSRETGLRFRFVRMAQAKALEALRLGELDMVGVTTGDYLWDKRNDIHSTHAYMRAPTMLVKRAQSSLIRRIALQGGYGCSEAIAADTSDKEILFYGTVRECFEALLRREVDAVYANVYLTNFLLSERRYESLIATSLSKYTFDIGFGISRQADPRLLSVLDKCVQYTAPERIDELVLKNASRSRPVSLLDFLAQNLLEVCVAVLSVFGIIFFLLSYSLVTKIRSNHRIQALLYKDSLTGLDNMTKWYMECARLLHNVPDGSYALLYGDIEQFKFINDNLGFAVGDQVLQAFGRILQQAVGDRECCARASADQFLLLMCYRDWQTLCVRMESIEKRLDMWRRGQGMSYRILTVFGVYLVSETEHLDVHRMLDFANYARRNAKQTAQSLLLYDTGMREEALAQRELEGRLESALEEGEFEAYFQPKVDMRDGRLIGAEALVRWNHPSRGLLMPGSFIPYFERKGLVMEVDLNIYAQVCKSIRAWLAQGLSVVPVSCNFSSLHFDRPDFLERIVAIAESFGVPLHLLDLEITESAAMRNPQTVCAQVKRLRECGFLVSIDDFGSGYSSLGLLQHLVVDTLKLDRSFVGCGLFEKRERTITGTVISMSRELGMKVICEGVENERQAAMLVGLGCYYAQGFLYARPMRREAFDCLLESGFVPSVAGAL